MRFTRLAPVIAALMLAFPAGALSATTLHVVGHGRVFVTPDVATVTITATRSANLSHTARARVNRVIARIVGGLVRIGVGRTNIQTSTITLSSSTVGRGHRRHRTFDAEVDLTVTIRRISLLSPLFDVASRAGADSYSGPNFGFSDPSAGLVQASGAALTDARRRADAAAAQVGMHVVGVQSVDLDPSGSSTQPSAGAPTAPSSGSGGALRKPTTPTLPGRQEVDADVDVVYVLGS
ncbi:MAG: SIMPL domain-containing protein [Actinomycetota bacterium]|nr:SIMPL domain-containing protein [Actinomycetota bacterium]